MIFAEENAYTPLKHSKKFGPGLQVTLSSQESLWRMIGSKDDISYEPMLSIAWFVCSSTFLSILLPCNLTIRISCFCKTVFAGGWKSQNAYFFDGGGCKSKGVADFKLVLKEFYSNWPNEKPLMWEQK